MDFYRGYYDSRITGVIKPFIEAEANYEDINCGGFTGYDLNRYSAWNAMLCGSAGFTYGVTGIWASATARGTPCSAVARASPTASQASGPALQRVERHALR